MNQRDSFFKKFIYLFIYLFLAVLGLRFCVRAFSSCGERGPLFIAVRRPLTIAASLVTQHRLQTRRLSSCGSWPQLLRGMWDLPRPGLEPVSPALAGRFSTTAPPGKPQPSLFDPLSCTCHEIYHHHSPFQHPPPQPAWKAAHRNELCTSLCVILRLWFPLPGQFFSTKLISHNTMKISVPLLLKECYGSESKWEYFRGLGRGLGSLQTMLHG